MLPPVPRMDAEQSRAWLALMSVTQLLPTVLDAQLTADAGLINFEYGILGRLNLAPQHVMRVRDLARELSSPVPKLSKAITRLENRKLVARVACAGDGGAVNVELTRDGRKAWLTATPPHIALARDTILADLTTDQLTALADLLAPIKGRLDPDSAYASLPEHLPSGR